ncbi:DUF5329 family protein [Arenimonas oryziterrae]|uniref:DUF5329 domain-containing protein n=1 Tax=Arenimonas oryziterrae DSM 21050 = YC6267 TaxID=1121015 RepID=A0A091ATK8_9GAMM|nr:DUF5329 family protein [Arenimonas oryziterrae]KFN43513.1 hypothetical protein N789_09570 [Arenimonas oryziterrae DSM 21050 = YC6267]
MNPFLKLCLFLLLAGFGVQTQAATEVRNEARDIEALIQTVAHLQGATFLRNGSEYTAVKAAEHLRLKWKNAGSRVKTAEQFIDYCATRSSMSGETYRIRLVDGKTVDSAVFLRARLKELRGAPATARPATR